MSQCNRCGAEIKWPENFEPGNRPLNLDSSLHKCSKKETPNSTPNTPSTGITANAVSAVSVLAEIEAFRVKFGSMQSDARFESLAKIYISRMMKR